MNGDEVTVSVLRSIRDEVVSLRADNNARFGEIHAQIGEVQAVIGETNRRIDFLAEGQVRMATEVAGLRSDVGELRGDLIRLTDRFGRFLGFSGHRQRNLEGRVRRLELHVGLED